MGSATAYILTLAGHHQSVVCVQYHKTVEFDECVLGKLEQQIIETLGFQIEGHLLGIYRRYSDCLS
ncbi:MAG: transcriptional repressor [Anaerolineae bacterium]